MPTFPKENKRGKVKICCGESHQFPVIASSLEEIKQIIMEAQHSSQEGLILNRQTQKETNTLVRRQRETNTEEFIT